MASCTPVSKPYLSKISTVFGLAYDGVSRGDEVQTWTNPAYDPGVGGDAAITVQPARDGIEEMFPRPRGMFRRMAIQFWAVIAFIIAHALVTAYTDPIYTRTPLVQVIVYSLQVGLLLAVIMAFFVLTSHTVYIQLGRYDLYLREFAFIYLFFLAELALYIAIKVYATVLLLKRASYLAMWDFPGYTALWAIQRVVLLLFWATAAYSATAVFDVRYFDPQELLRADGRDGSGQKEGDDQQRSRRKR